jgi:hypothetical protein
VQVAYNIEPENHVRVCARLVVIAIVMAQLHNAPEGIKPDWQAMKLAYVVSESIAQEEQENFE